MVLYTVGATNLAKKKKKRGGKKERKKRREEKIWHDTGFGTGT